MECVLASILCHVTIKAGLGCGSDINVCPPCLSVCVRATGTRHAGRKAWMPGPWPSASSCSDRNCGSSQWTAEEKGGVLTSGATPSLSGGERFSDLSLLWNSPFIQSSRVWRAGEWSWSTPPPLLNSTAAVFKSRKTNPNPLVMF